MSEGEYWFCVTHHAVEGDDGCPNEDRLGPYDSAEEASHALENVQRRNQEWDNDRDWKDGEPAGEPPEK